MSNARAPKGSKEQKAEVFGLLCQVAPRDGTKCIADFLEELVRSVQTRGGASSVFCGKLTGSTAAWWRTTLVHWHKCKVLEDGSSLSPAGAGQGQGASKSQKRHWRFVLYDQVQRKVTEAALHVAKDAPVVQRKPRSKASAATRSVQSNTLLPGAVATGTASVPELRPRQVRVQVTAQAMIPARLAPYVPDDAQQVTQLLKVRSWCLGRLLRGAAPSANFFFSIGALTEAVRKWREEEPRTREDAVPELKLLRKYASCEIVRTMTSQFTGHVWEVRDLGPLDAGQMAALQGVPQLAKSWQRLVEEGHVTASELRQLVGGGTQDGAVERAWQAALDLLTVEAKKALNATGKDREGHKVKKSIGLVGGGLHTSGYQLRRHIPGAFFAWSMEVNELAKRGA